MFKRLGKSTLSLLNRPSILSGAAVVGKTEGEGPLQKEFDCIYEDDTLGEESFEKAESHLQKEAIRIALEKAQIKLAEIEYIFGGDLLNQCTASAFALRDLPIAFLGVYGACSTMALSLGLAGVFTNAKAAQLVLAETSSHFCAAERQFRLPLEYGGQRTPTAQRTATAAGATVVTAEHRLDCPYLSAVTFGHIVDLDIHDSNNMGAAMAPAAADTIATFFKDTDTSPLDYDAIFTGDLGTVGSTLLNELLEKDYGISLYDKQKDCGLLLFDCEKQDVHAGGSGCGCAASVLNSYILHRLCDGTFHKVLLVATGALLSPTTSMQGESIPGIAHAVCIEMPERIKI